jgi:hypothetical protein
MAIHEQRLKLCHEENLRGFVFSQAYRQPLFVIQHGALGWR